MKLKPIHFVTIILSSLVAIITLIFYFTDLDLLISGYFYDPSGPVRFPVGNMAPWTYFNEMNRDYPIIAALALLLVFLIIGLVKKRNRPYLVYTGFILISVLVSVVIVEGLFKGIEIDDFYIGWSRPRPRELEQFGEDPLKALDFYRIWEPAFLDGLSNTNSSFPSGHVATGGYIIAFFFMFNNVDFLMEVAGGKSKGKKILFNSLKYGFLLLSIVLGIMLAISRISAGAHFASDSMYSYVFTWGPTAFMYYLVFNIPKKERKAFEKMKAAAAPRESSSPPPEGFGRISKDQ
ncbi:MAG: phosphatase PAP2 family protein [Candidatus Hodarchaeota archaeon]